jgi:predicted membrane protein
MTFIMKKSKLFYVFAALAVLALLAGIYYSIPGVYHPLLFFDHAIYLINVPKINAYSHHKYTAVFLVVALAFFFLAYLLQRRKKVIA